MKVVILAGGFGSRITEESRFKPKPMVEIGGKPILVHIMEYFASFGHKEFIICAGYKQECIKEYFLNKHVYDSKRAVFTNGSCSTICTADTSDWKVTVVDTGIDAMTGRRLSLIKDLIAGDEPFFMTYGDGLCDVDLNHLTEMFLDTPEAHCITTFVKPDSRFGVATIELNGKVTSFREKSSDDTDWINGGYMIMPTIAIDYITGNQSFEQEPMASLAKDGKLYAYKHTGNWQCMDTMRDKEKLEKEYQTSHPFWVRNFR